MPGVDLRALIVAWVRLYRMNQARCASRSALLRDRVSRLGGRMEMYKYQLIENWSVEINGQYYIMG